MSPSLSPDDRLWSREGFSQGETVLKGSSGPRCGFQWFASPHGDRVWFTGVGEDREADASPGSQLIWDPGGRENGVVQADPPALSRFPRAAGTRASAVRRPRPKWLRERGATQSARLWRPGRSPQVPNPGSRPPAPPARGPHGAHVAAPHLPAPTLLVPALLLATSAAPAAAERAAEAQRPRAPRARAAKAPRVPPGLTRAERAGPGSWSPSARRRRSRVACAPDPGPAGPRPPGRAWMPPPGWRDGPLLGERG